MRAELHDYLDGERTRDDLPSDLCRPAERWDAFLSAIAASAPASAPAWLEAGVMRELRASPSSSRLPVWLEWLWRARPIRISPLAAGLAAALLLVVALRPWSDRGLEGLVQPPSAVYVLFVVEAPGARTVALAGDFSAWEPAIPLEDVDGDGVWSARVAIAPGVHEYMFVLDGTEWVTDPHAARWSDDGFGNRNAILAVAAPPDGT